MAKFDGKVEKQMLDLLWPSLLLTLLQGLMTAVDASLAGHISRTALAAMSLVYPFFLLMQTVSLGGFGGAVAANIAKSSAQKNPVLVTQGIYGGIALSLLIGICCSLFFFVFGEYVINYLVKSKNIAQMATRYGFLMVGFAPVFWLCNCILSIARGLGMVRQILVTASLVYPFQLFVIGVLFLTGQIRDIVFLGLATLIGISLVGAVTAIQISKHPQFIRGRRVVISNIRKTIGSLVSVGLFSSISSIITGLSLVLLSLVVARRFGPDVLSGFGIVLRVEVIAMSIASCIGVAVVTLGARSLGKNEIKTAIHIAIVGVLSSVILIGCLGFIAALFPEFILQYFILNVDSFAASSNYLGIVGWSYPLMATGFASFFVGQSLGRPRLFFFAALFRFLFLFGAFLMGPTDLSTFILLIAAGYGIFGLFALLALLYQYSRLHRECKNSIMMLVPIQEEFIKTDLKTASVRGL